MDFIFIFWKNQKYWFNVLLEEQLKRFGESSKCSNLKFSRNFGAVGMASSHCHLYCHDRVGSSTFFFCFSVFGFCGVYVGVLVVMA